ncbi:DUF6300 family protein [Streptomyces sp. NPDC007084]|uniref:DUF6300 family protein n=1 Tax=Streptomyces sp. NPDC007084 TaxID=3154313 RepID=UPI0034571E8F
MARRSPEERSTQCLPGGLRGTRRCVLDAATLVPTGRYGEGGGPDSLGARQTDLRSEGPRRALQSGRGGGGVFGVGLGVRRDPGERTDSPLPLRKPPSHRQPPPARSAVHSLETSDRLPPCSRCGGSLFVSCVAPRNDTAGRPIHLELCGTCDGEKPAAGAFLFWFASGGGHDTERGEEGARCLLEWTREAMADHGWHWNPAHPTTFTPTRPHDESTTQALMNPATRPGPPEPGPG